VIEKRNVWNIFVIKNIILKGKTHKQKANIYVRDDLRDVVSLWKVSREHNLVQVIKDFY